uniref:Uncharacterized protein n=1 Tax=Lepeophtheirus salmonis TaxID=72036 RepID=A0A0K2TE34_LEPSM
MRFTSGQNEVCRLEGSHVLPAKMMHLLGRFCRGSILGRDIVVPGEHALQPEDFIVDVHMLNFSLALKK